MTVIVLSGPVGAGKSSLTAILSKYLGTKPFYESVDDNPVLPLFYKDPLKYTYLLQLFFFGSFFSYIGGSSFVFQNVYHVSAQTYSLIFGGIGIGLLVAGTVPARFAGRVPDEKLLSVSLRIPLAGAVLLLAGFLLHAPLLYTLLVLFVTIVPLSVMGTASFSLALSRQGKSAGSASALQIVGRMWW